MRIPPQIDTKHRKDSALRLLDEFVGLLSPASAIIRMSTLMLNYGDAKHLIFQSSEIDDIRETPH